MLEIANLTKDYKDFRAVSDISFNVGPGQILGVLGPNGAGKTSMIRCIAGILRPSSGSIRINGVDLLADSPRAKQGLAFVPEVPSLYELLTVYEHLRFIALAFDTLDVFDAEHQRLLERFSLWEKRNDLVATLSKGMKQKLAVACALVHRANVFLFDEPLIGIDPAGAHELKAEIMSLRENGASILVSTHLLDTAEKLCDRVLIMNRGKLLAEGTLEELREFNDAEGMSLEDLFLKMTSAK